MKDEYIRENKESIGSLGQVGAEPDTEPTLFSVFAGQGQVGRGDDEEPGQQGEGGREGRVMKAVGDYFARKRKRR